MNLKYVFNLSLRTFCYKSVVLLTAVVFVTTLIPTHAHALSEEQARLHGLGIHYYEPNACPAINLSEGSSGGGNLSGSELYMVGDSITVGAKDQLENSFQEEEISAFINGSVSRSILRAGTTDGYKTSGLRAVEGDKDQISNSKTIIIALGTNVDGDGTGRTYAQNMTRLINNIVDINSEANLYVANIFSPDVSNKNQLNNSLGNISGRLDFKIIDLNTANISTGDGIHPDEAGRTKLVKTIVDSVVGGQSPVTQAPQENSNTSRPTSSSDSVQDLAKKMLANSNIIYWTNRGVNTRDVIVALSKGEQAFTTAPDGQPERTNVNKNILLFILEAAKEGQIMVNALTDKDHSSTSNHYKGLAVDIEKGSATQIPQGRLIEIAEKFGGKKNSETTHHHFDFLNLPPDNDSGSEGPSQTSTELTPGQCACSAAGGPTLGDVSSDLPSVIPDYWRNLISNAAPQHTSSDPRLVAAVLWAENRGWPDPNRDWAVSSAGAQGPFQFIPSTWASMGRDGDGDGIKDPNNPADAVHAAFIHHTGSSGKILVEGFNGDAESYFNQAVFQRDGNNLLSFGASYNGRGAPSGVKLSNFPRNENSDYVRMVYWLIGTNFSQSWHPERNAIVDAAAGGIAGNDSGNELVSNTGCGSTPGDSSGVLVGDLAWPLPINFVNNNFEWFTKPHHDHPSADMPVQVGTDVYSITDGEVLHVNPNGYGGGYGAFLTIEYRNTLFRYQHAENGTITVKKGDTVQAGQLIMKSGNTGYSTGPHLHVSIETGGSNPIQRTTEHCPQELFKAMKSNSDIPEFSSLPTTGCIGPPLVF